MADRPRRGTSGRTPFPTAAGRVVAIGAAFLLVSAGLFAGVGAWQSDDPTAEAAPDEPDAPAPAPDEDTDVAAPEPAPGPDPAPEPDPEPDPEPEPVPAGPDPADVSVQLLDAELDDGGAALGRAAATLEDAGFDVVARNRVAASRASSYATTTVLYTPGFETEGRLVATTLGATEVRAVTAANSLDPGVMVHVVVRG